MDTSFKERLVVQDMIDARGVTSFSITVAVLCAVVLFADGFNTQIIGFIAPAITKEWGSTKPCWAWFFRPGSPGCWPG